MARGKRVLINETEAAEILGVTQSRISQMILKEKVLQYRNFEGERGLERTAVVELCIARGEKKVGKRPDMYQPLVREQYWQTLYGERYVADVMQIAPHKARYLLETAKLPLRDYTRVTGGPRTLGADIELYLLDKSLVEWRQFYNRVYYLAQNPKHLGRYNIKAVVDATEAEIARIERHRKRVLSSINAWKTMNQVEAYKNVTAMQMESAKNLAEMRRRKEEEEAYFEEQERLIDERIQEWGEKLIPLDEWEKTKTTK